MLSPREDEYRVVKNHRGVRVLHGGYTEWPMVNKNGDVSLVSFSFDGKYSSGMKWMELPSSVRLDVHELLHTGPFRYC